MQTPFQMKIYDPDSVTTILDQVQLEGMLVSRLERLKHKIDKIRIRVKKLNSRWRQQYSLSEEHLATFEIHLANGKVVRGFAQRVSKGAVLVAAVDRIYKLAKKRIRFESTILCRTWDYLKNMYRTTVSKASSYGHWQTRSCKPNGS